jgi:NADPH:quinone reductase-like Zn-dependent oxidoreductase
VHLSGPEVSLQGTAICTLLRTTLRTANQRSRPRLSQYSQFLPGGWLFPGRKRVVPYSMQTLKRLKPAWFRQDLIALFDLLQQKKIKPLIARRFPLTEARQAHELLGQRGVVGKIVLVPKEAPLKSGAT